MKIRFITTLVSCFLLTGAAVQTLADNEQFQRCGTPELVRLMSQGAFKIASGRLDTLTRNVVSSGGHFRVHYDASGYNAPSIADGDMNGIPDYIDSTLVYLEYAWNLEINVLGFKAPSDDNGAGGGDEIDVYVRNFGTSGYGITYPETQADKSVSAYMQIDNDYKESQYSAKGYAALRVTTAHEFMHVIQFSYKIDSTVLIWWMEHVGTWMEERAWDDVNDYLAYLKNFYLYQNKYPIDHISYGDNFMYGAVVWPIYLSKRFGDGIIRNLWNTIIADRNFSIASFDRVIPGGLGAALNEFGIWNYFTAGRADSDKFLPDAAQFLYTVATDASVLDWPAENNLSTVNLSSNYIECFFAGAWGTRDAIRVDYTASTGRTHETSIVFINSTADYRIERNITSGSSIPLKTAWSRAVIVTTCVNTASPGGSFQLELARDANAAADGDGPISFAVQHAQPNPFNASTTIRFIMPRSGHAEVRVYDMLGRQVATLLDSELSAGEKAVLWKPGDLAAGMYFVRVVTPAGEKTVKTMFLK